MKLKLFFVCSFLFFFFPGYVKAQVVINEFVPDASPEWVELKNASESAEYLKNYYLDDDTDFSSDSGSSPKILLSGLVISNISYPYINLDSFLNNSGDFVVLFNSEGVIIDQYQYLSNPGGGLSIGRNPDGTGNFFTLSSLTKSSENSGILSTSTPVPTTPPQITTPDPTNTPTITPLPTPTKTATPKPSPTPKISPTVLPSMDPSVMSASDEETLATPSLIPETVTTNSGKKKEVPFAAAIFLVGGVVAFILAGISFAKIQKGDVTKDQIKTP